MLAACTATQLVAGSDGATGVTLFKCDAAADAPAPIKVRRGKGGSAAHVGAFRSVGLPHRGRALIPSRALPLRGRAQVIGWPHVAARSQVIAADLIPRPVTSMCLLPDALLPLATSPPTAALMAPDLGPPPAGSKALAGGPHGGEGGDEGRAGGTAVQRAARQPSAAAPAASPQRPQAGGAGPRRDDAALARGGSFVAAAPGGALLLHPQASAPTVQCLFAFALVHSCPAPRSLPLFTPLCTRSVAPGHCFPPLLHLAGAVPEPAGGRRARHAGRRRRRRRRHAAARAAALPALARPQPR